MSDNESNNNNNNGSDDGEEEIEEQQGQNQTSTTTTTENTNQPSTDLPPFSPFVNFQQLANYPKTSLLAPQFFQRSNKQIKPVTLIMMGFGIENFPDTSLENPTIKRACARNKHQMFNVSDILPTTKCAKPHLQKEAWRRAITKDMERRTWPRVKNWNNAKIIEYLKENPPLESEHEFIVEAMNSLLEEMHEHYMRTRPKFMNYRDLDTDVDEEEEDGDGEGGGGGGGDGSGNEGGADDDDDEAERERAYRSRRRDKKRRLSKKRRNAAEEDDSGPSKLRDRSAAFGIVIVPQQKSENTENDGDAADTTITNSSFFDPDKFMVVSAPIQNGQLIINISNPSPPCIMRYNASDNMIGAASCIDGYMWRRKEEELKLLMCKFTENGTTLYPTPISEWSLGDHSSCGVDETTARLQSIQRILRVLFVA